MAQHKNIQGVAYAPEMISAYDTLKEFIEKQLRRNAYSIVNLNTLFATSANVEISFAQLDEGSDYEVSDDDEVLAREDVN